MLTNKVYVNDKGWNRIKRDIRRLDEAHTKVGFVENAAVKPGKKGSGEKQLTSMNEVAEIAVINNYGTRNIPQREFMGSSFDEKKPELLQIQSKAYNSVIDGKISVKKGLKILGVWGSRTIKKKITALKSPPNAPYTIKRKGSSNPLIDTGQMRASVTSKEFVK